MATRTDGTRTLSDLVPHPQTLLVLGAVTLAELLVLAWYFALTSASPNQPRYLLYPFVWINVGLLAVWRTTTPSASDRDRRIGLAVAGGYALLLAYFGGLLAPGYLLQGHAGPAPPTAFRAVFSVPPGWGPYVYLSTPLATVTLLPFKVVGYAALTYLVYATVLDATGSAVGGVVGLLSCVSCSWPILASVATGFFGATASISAAAVYSASYDLSTVVFVATVALLFWRPFGR